MSLSRKIIVAVLSIIAFLILLVVVANALILPEYVDRPEIEVPDVRGMEKTEAAKVLEDNDLKPIEEGTRYDEEYEKDHVIFQKPEAGSTVKKGRRVYLHISGGEPLIKMPPLVGKTIRDARVTIGRLGFKIGKIEEVRSEFSPNTVVEQEFDEGETLTRGSTIDLKVSIGPELGMLRVPNLLGKSLKEAEVLLRSSSLKLGKKTFQPSLNLLPNTIIDQYPGAEKLVSVGDSVDVVITKSVSSN